MPISPVRGRAFARLQATLLALWALSASRAGLCDEAAWNVVQNLKAAYANHMPDDMSCVMRVSFLPGEDRDGFQVRHPIPALKMLWKKPNRMTFTFLEKDPRGTSYFEARLQPFFARLKRMRAVNELNISLFDVAFAVLEGDANSKVLGHETIGGRKSTQVHFPSIFAPLPMGARGNGLKLWVDDDNGLPLQVRFFTNRGIFTFTTTYETQKDKTGRSYLLPVSVVLTPDLTEKRRSAAFPITTSITDYQLNTGLDNAAFE